MTLASHAQFPRSFALFFLLAASASAIARESAAQEGSVTVHELDPKTGMALHPKDTSLTYLSVGPTFGLVGGAVSGATGGLEASLMHYQEPRLFSFSYGAFAQGNLFMGKDLRTALGVQGAAGPAGIELGLGLRAANTDHATTLSFHSTVFLSAGYLVFSFQLSPAIVAFPSNEPSYGFETAFILSLKVPIAVQGRDPSGLAIQAAPVSW